MYRYRFVAALCISSTLCNVAGLASPTNAAVESTMPTKKSLLELPRASWWSSASEVEQYELARRYSPFARTFRIFYGPSANNRAEPASKPAAQNFSFNSITTTTASSSNLPSRALFYYDPTSYADKTSTIRSHIFSSPEQTTTTLQPIFLEPSLATDTNAYIAPSPSPVSLASYGASTNVQSPGITDDPPSSSAAALTVSQFEYDNQNATTPAPDSTGGSFAVCDIRYGQYANIHCRRRLGSRAAYCSSVTSLCECRRGYAMDGITCRAVNSVRIVGDRCASTTDCQFALQNSYCNDTFQTCQCVPGFVLGAKLNTCVPFAQGIGDGCETAQQCAAIPNSYCAKTVENDGQRSSHPRVSDTLTSAVTAAASSTFDDDFSASIKNARSADGECRCRSGYVVSSDSGQTCVPQAQAVGDSCLVDRQCESLWIANLSCISGFCICPPTTMIYLPRNNICASRSGLGQSCLDSAQCDAGVLNSVCSSETGSCRCRNGYDNFGNQFCLQRSKPRQDPPALIRRRLPGEACAGSPECNAGAANSTCTEGTCQCNFGLVFVPTDNSCRAVAALDDPCFFTEQCVALAPNAVCGDDGRRCKCQQGFIAVGDRCIPESKALGDLCTLTAQCQGISKHAVCRAGVCTCEPGISIVQQSGSTATCLDETAYKLGDLCSAAADCQNLQLTAKEFSGIDYSGTGVANVVVCHDGQCRCTARTHVRVEQQCLPIKNMGENCSTDTQCEASVNDSLCSRNNITASQSTTADRPQSLFSSVLTNFTYAQDEAQVDDDRRICRCRPGTLAISDPPRCLQTNLPVNTLCLRNEQCQSNICQYRHEFSAYACTTRLQVQMRLLNRMRSIFQSFSTGNNGSGSMGLSLNKVFRRLNHDILGDTRNDVILRPALLDLMAANNDDSANDDDMTVADNMRDVAVERKRRRLPASSTTKGILLNSTTPPRLEVAVPNANSGENDKLVNQISMKTRLPPSGNPRQVKNSSPTEANLSTRPVMRQQ